MSYKISAKLKPHIDWFLRFLDTEDEVPRITEWDQYWSKEFPFYADKLQVARDKERTILRGNVSGRLK